MHSEGPSNPRVTIAVTRQLNQLRAKAPAGVTLILNDADIFDIQAELEGPVQTPYQGGIFRCKLSLPQDFPKQPPKGYFLTKIFHPNVSEKGEICVNTLKKDWNPQNWSFYNIFEVVKCLLIIPFPESALNEEAGKLFMEDYDSYFKYAKLLTDLHAKPKITSNKMEIEKHATSMKPTIQESQGSQQPSQQIPSNHNNDDSHEKNSGTHIKSQQISIKDSTTAYTLNQSTLPSLSSMPQGFQSQLPLQQQQSLSTPLSGGSYHLQSSTNSSNQMPSTPHITQNSPFRDTVSTTKSSLNSLQKSQNQENLQCQPNFGFAGIQLTQEEPLCVLSKNNGYYSNNQVSVGPQGQLKQQQQPSMFYPFQPFQQQSNQTQQAQQQQQQQQNKNEILMKLTFNNPSPQNSSQNISQTAGKQQNEKKKWLKRI